MGAAASALLLTGCGDALLPGDQTVPLEDLLVLAQQPDAPPPAALSFYARNAVLTVRTLRHPDATNNAYAEFSFPPGALASLNGQPLTTTDSVLVTVEPRPGGYGVTVSPSGLAFTLDNTPTVTFVTARYADLSVADGSPTYPTLNAYASALRVWQEVGLDRWQVAKGSSRTTNGVAAAIDEPGEYVVAAPR